MSTHHDQILATDDTMWNDNEPERSPMNHVHEPVTATLTAEALLHIAGRILQTAEHHFGINNVTAAVGAIGATECNLNMARDYLGRAEELVENGANPTGTETVHDLVIQLEQHESSIAEHAETAAQRSHYQNLDEDVATWYCHRFQMTQSLAGVRLLLDRLATLPTDVDNLDRAKQAHILAAYDVSMTPEVVPQHHDPQEALRQPDGYTRHKDKIERNAQSAAAELHELMERVQREFAQSIPTVISPAMTAAPDILERLHANPVGVGACHIGFADSGEEVERGPILFTIDELDTERFNEALQFQIPLHYVAFLHDARCHVISIGEPYPPGFPAERVMQHMEAARQHLETAAPHMSELLYLNYEKAIKGAESAAYGNVHCLTPEEINSFFEQVKKMGMPRGIRRLLMDGISNHDPYLADRLLGERDDHHWYDRLCSRRAARQITEAARKAGVDEYALADLAESMGFDPQQLGVRNHPLGRRKMQALRKAAQEANIDEQSWERMAENILMSHDQLRLVPIQR